MDYVSTKADLHYQSVPWIWKFARESSQLSNSPELRCGLKSTMTYPSAEGGLPEVRGGMLEERGQVTGKALHKLETASPVWP